MINGCIIIFIDNLRLMHKNIQINEAGIISYKIQDHNTVATNFCIVVTVEKKLIYLFSDRFILNIIING